MADQIKTLERGTKVQEVGRGPNTAEVVNNIAKQTNMLSALGSNMAKDASNMLAEKLGNENGQTLSNEDKLPPILDAQKHYQQAYNVQAQMTLTNRASEMMVEGQLELAKAPKLTPGLVDTYLKNMTEGRQALIDQAPPAIRGQVNQQITTSLLKQSAEMQTKVIAQQQKDFKQTFDVSIKNNAVDIYELAQIQTPEAQFSILDKMDVVTTNAEQQFKSGIIGEVEKDTAIKTVRMAMLKGKYFGEALAARDDGTLEDWKHNFATTKPEEMSSVEWVAVSKSVIQDFDKMNSLNDQQRELDSAKFANRIITDAAGITDTDLLEFEKKVDPVTYQKMLMKYNTAMVKSNNSAALVNQAKSQWNNVEVMRNTPAALLKQATQELTLKRMDDSKKNGIEITYDEAETLVASAAGIILPDFKDKLEKNLLSSNPFFVAQASVSIQTLASLGQGRYLQSVSPKAQAINGDYEANKTFMQKTEAAVLAINNVNNQDPNLKKLNNSNWVKHLAENTPDGINNTDFALSLIGKNVSDFSNPSIAGAYAATILAAYHEQFNLLNSNSDVAKSNIQRFVASNYGQTWVNGKESTTLHPIEDVLGFEGSSDITPYVQQDVADFLTKRFQMNKEEYKKGLTNEYWEVEPRDALSHKTEASGVMAYGASLISAPTKPIRVIRHIRNGTKTFKDTMEVELVGNSNDSWHVNVKSDGGSINIFQVAPYVGTIAYTPDPEKIENAYYGIKGITLRNKDAIE